MEVYGDLIEVEESEPASYEPSQVLDPQERLSYRARFRNLVSRLSTTVTLAISQAYKLFPREMDEPSIWATLDQKSRHV